MPRIRWPLIALLVISFPRLSQACQGTSLLLDENFAPQSQGWDAPDKYIAYGKSGVALTLDPSQSYFALNRQYTSDGTDICTTFSWPSTPWKGDLGDAGLVFWAKDYTNYYVFGVGDSGDAFVDRYVAGKPVSILSKDQKDLGFIKQGPGATNEIEVQIAGPKVTLFAGGKMVGTFNGQPPAGSGNVGVYLGNRSTSPLTLAFSRFQLYTFP